MSCLLFCLRQGVQIDFQKCLYVVRPESIEETEAWENEKHT